MCDPAKSLIWKESLPLILVGKLKLAWELLQKMKNWMNLSDILGAFLGEILVNPFLTPFAYTTNISIYEVRIGPDTYASPGEII